MTENNNGPAFPTIGNIAYQSDWLTEEGMTRRDYFAGQALTGLLTGRYAETGRYDYSEVPQEAYGIADAMLAESARGEKTEEQS